MAYNRKSHAFRTPKELYTSATTWKARAGRNEGPDEYLVGDLVRSVMLRQRAMPQRERQELYGCPVLLIGACSATGLDCDDGARLYCSVRTTDENERDLKSGRLRTALASVQGGNVDFDDVCVLGSSGDLESVSTLTLRVKRFNGALRRQTTIGEVAIPMRRIIAIAHADMPPCDIEYALRGSPAGRLRVKLFLHYPPPDPRPIAIQVAIAEGRALLPRDATGFSDPYVKVRLMMQQRGKAASEAATGRPAEFRTSTQPQTLNPVWPDRAIFVDERATRDMSDLLSSEDGSSSFSWGAFSGVESVEEWHGPPPGPSAPGAAPASTAPTGVGHAPNLSTQAAEASAVTGSPSEAPDAEATCVQEGVPVPAQAEASSEVVHEAATAPVAPALSLAPEAAAPPATSTSAAAKHEDASAFASRPQCSRIVCDSISDVKGLSFLVMDWDAVTSDDDMGECYVSLSSLFGDEDAVVGTHTLSVHKWVRLRPTKLLSDSGFDLGHVLLHITLAFEQPLLPPMWQESVDAETGEGVCTRSSPHNSVLFFSLPMSLCRP
jgi:hypothetical protein